MTEQLSAEEEVAVRARHDAGQPLKAFDYHAAHGTPGDWKMARIFVEETAIDRARLIATLEATRLERDEAQMEYADLLRSGFRADSASWVRKK